MPDEPSISRLTSLPGWRERLGELDPIFFEASLTKRFASDAARSAFRSRWLGRYLDRWPDLAHVAVDPAGRAVGYIVGGHGDPATDPMLADVGYWPLIAHLTARYPAHLHINLATSVRSQGTGSRLLAAFCNDARDAGIAGVHLVTGRDSRNRTFYARNGFDEVASLVWGGTPIVMLARQP
jgi:GNAT superfamily N-acetyltransferase